MCNSCKSNSCKIQSCSCNSCCDTYKLQTVYYNKPSNCCPQNPCETITIKPLYDRYYNQCTGCYSNTKQVYSPCGNGNCYPVYVDCSGNKYYKICN